MNNSNTEIQENRKNVLKLKKVRGIKYFERYF
jgi:hypothetical protein